MDPGSKYDGNQIETFHKHEEIGRKPGQRGDNLNIWSHPVLESLVRTSTLYYSTINQTGANRQNYTIHVEVNPPIISF